MSQDDPCPDDVTFQGITYACLLHAGHSGWHVYDTTPAPEESMTTTPGWTEIDGLWAYRPSPALARARQAVEVLQGQADLWAEGRAEQRSQQARAAALLLVRLTDAREHLAMDLPHPVLDAADAWVDALLGEDA